MFVTPLDFIIAINSDENNVIIIIIVIIDGPWSKCNKPTLFFNFKIVIFDSEYILHAETQRSSTTRYPQDRPYDILKERSTNLAH